MSFMQYDQESAEKAESSGITETGAYIGLMSTAMGTANTGTKYVEFTLKSEAGSANWMKVYYEKADGTELSGKNIINAIMGLLRLNAITIGHSVDSANTPFEFIPEFQDKPIGLVLQKVLYTKNDGGEGYKFDIKFPFSAKTRVTLKEALANSPAEAVDKALMTLKDKDERGQNNSQGNQGGFSGGGQAQDLASYDQMGGGF